MNTPGGSAAKAEVEMVSKAAAAASVFFMIVPLSDCGILLFLFIVARAFKIFFVG